MTARLLAIAVIALLGGGGCGGGSRARDAAELAPADATAFVQLRGARPPHAYAFPFVPKSYAALERALPNDLTTLARRVDVALLPLGAVAFVQPRDPKAFDASLDARGLVHRRSRGFTLVARTPSALDAVRHAKAKLADDARYVAATKTLDDEALAAYLTPRFRGDVSPSVRWLALGVTRDSVALHYRSQRRPSSRLTDVAVPKDTVAAVGVAAGAPPPAAGPTLGTISRALGLDLGKLQRALGGPAFAYLESGGAVPRVTVVATPGDPGRAKRDVGRLLAPLGRPSISPSPSLTALDLGPLALFYGLAHGRLVLSDDETAAEQDDQADPIDGLPEAVTRFAYTHGATPTIAAIAPGLGLTAARPTRDFLLYETYESGLWSRVVTTPRDRP
jgi:hypothetical protein